MKPATFNCTVLRDGHQSLAATRMSTEQMLKIAPILDTMGFSALETWGGASIDSGLRFLGEHPFDRLDTLKKEVGLPVWIHTRETAGLGAATYVAGINAGADAVDASIAPFANGTEAFIYNG